MTTGSGFTPAFYTAFNLLWYKDMNPAMFSKIHKVIGTKDYINYRMTGRLCTAPSYASGSGVWDLKNWNYSDELMEAMAYKEGRVYNPLGSSSWIAVSTKEPVLDVKKAPYVFAHVVPGYFASALCVTAGGTAFRWMRDVMCQEFLEEPERTGADVYDLMTEEAKKSPVGSNGLIFNPSLGGGMPMNKSYHLRGAFLGLDLIHTRADIIRASMEGITMGLCSGRYRAVGKL